jgi:hypothetical protein
LRQPAQVLTIQGHQVEDAVLKIGCGAQCILQQLEVGNAVRVDRDQLAIDSAIVPDLLECFGDRLVVVAHDHAVARVKRDAAPLDAGDKSEAVPFCLVHPARIVEGRIRQRGQHGLQVLGKLGLSWHGSQHGKIRWQSWRLT